MTIFGSSPQDLTMSEPTSETWMSFERWRQLLPMTRRDIRGSTITCHDYLGRPKTHREEPRYLSPTTGVCRRLVVQAVEPKEPNEHPIRDHTGHVNKLALWLLSTNPFRDSRTFFKWSGTWLLFTFGLLWYFIWWIIQVLVQAFFLIEMPVAQMDLLHDWLDDSEVYNTGDYKPYIREFRGQLWEARSKKEHSTRVKGLDEEEKEEKEEKIPTHSLHPRLLMIRDPTWDEWSPCTEPSTIIRNKYIAISYHAADVHTSGPDEKREKERFVQEVRAAAVQKNFNAYWLDLECIGETPDEKNLDIYCMADVYRGAESTLIMLGSSREGKAAWERWGARVWTLPEALLSKKLFYKFRDANEINSVSLHQLANLAYPEHNSEQAVIDAYSEKDPLERLERLSLLKSAVWRRGISVASTREWSGPHAAERVYALMGFFHHRIRPSYAEEELPALARLFMANDNDRIAERMISLLPSIPHPKACWYADNDIYDAELFDIIPETQVAGILENGALVLDGCRAAAIRWKDFPEIAHERNESVRRKVVGFIPYLAWPLLIVGIAAVTTKFSVKGGIALVVIGTLLLLVSPKLFVISEAGRVINPQPWFIGVKGVLDINTAAEHLYGGKNMGHYPRLDYTPSGSEFAVPERGPVRGGSKEQYDTAKRAEACEGGQIFTLIDTYASAIYYFRAEKPPTVCLFTGREGGLGRFVLCSEKCDISQLHKETVLRMPTEVSQRMEMCGWVALG